MVRLRRALLWLLPLLLLLTIARQVFDFLGFLWIPIIANFFHILFTIVALFGVAQFRPAFLVTFVFWLLPWLAWNAFLLCFYLGLGGLNPNSLVLGFGARGTRSFWVEHTPLCQTAYDYERQTWVTEDCILDFHWVEAIIAIVHIAYALVIFILALVFLTLFSKASKQDKKSTQPRVTVEFTEPHHSSTHFISHPVNGSAEAAARNPGYVSDSSGYINTSFEPNSPGPLTQQQMIVPQLQNGHLVQKNPRRSSKKKKKERRLEEDTTEEIIYGDFTPRSDQFSVAATAELTDGGRVRTRASSSTRETRDAKAQRRRDRNARSVSPGSRRQPHHGSVPAIAQLAPEPIGYEPAYRQRTFSGAKRPYKHYNGRTGSQPDILGSMTASKDDPEGHILAYHNEPRRISVAEPRGIQGPRDSILHPRDRPKGKPMSNLISFDPKSDQTLIRYQTHLNRSRDALRSTDDSADSPPLHMAPSLQPTPPSYQKRTFPSAHRYQPSATSDRASYDSGIPSSLGNGGSSEGSTSSQPSTRSDLQSILHRPTHFTTKPNSANYYEPPSHTRQGSLPPPPPLAPIRDGVLMALDDSMDSTFSIPPPPPPEPARRAPAAFFLPPLSAQLSQQLQRSSDDLHQQPYARQPPSPRFNHQNSLLV